MTVERYLRLIAGAFTMASVALAHFHDPRWLYFTAFIGLNLFQSAFTDWCPMMSILEKMGVKRLSAMDAASSQPNASAKTA